ncbi:3-hydroxyacyl-CoA dehydratase 1 [Myotis davidii]|uniref:Very-long-chain (3R)-3-hydroxyacyl-CoA dehydratase n=1 Tax=Myotis davidii TaxID=225400 RepID=L5LRZ1_MYODS|nr:3-hydroxyacyl-CoA dehydratase 1 [Myotis davidii]
MAGRYLLPVIQKNKRGEGHFKSQTNRRSQTHGPRPHFQQLGASIRPQLWPRIPLGARTQHPPERRRPSPTLPARFSQRLGPSTRCHASCSSRALSAATLRAILPKPTVPAQGPFRGLPESHLPSKRMRQARDLLLRTLKVGASGKGDTAWPGPGVRSVRRERAEWGCSPGGGAPGAAGALTDILIEGIRGKERHLHRVPRWLVLAITMVRFYMEKGTHKGLYKSIQKTLKFFQTFALLEIQNEESVVLFLVAWTVTEITRYSFYTFSLLNHLPYFIKWARLMLNH